MYQIMPAEQGKSVDRRTRWDSLVRVGISRFDTYLIHRRSAVEINLLTFWHV
jgi:hypothetical protein